MKNMTDEDYEAMRDRDEAYDRLVSDWPDPKPLTETEEIFGSESAFWLYKEGRASRR
jgi:hypothetical protein